MEIRNIEASLTERFAVFETMLRSQHAVITTQMENVLPQIAADFERFDRKSGDLSVDELDALTKKYGVQHIYFIDRSYKVFQTNLASEMNFVFPKGQFTQLLDSVFGANKVMSYAFPVSVTGTSPPATSDRVERI